MNTIQKLGADIKVTATGAKQVEKLAVALERLKSISLQGMASKVNSLEKMLAPFKSMDSAKGLSKFANALNKLQAVNVGNAATSIKNMASALKPLTNEMLRGEKAALSYSTVLGKLSTKAITSGNAVQKAGFKFNIFNSGFQKLAAGIFIVDRVKTAMMGFVNESNNYIENLNLFAVAMGGFYSEAKAYAEQVGDKLGIDPSQWMRQQGIIMDMAKSFGVAKESAYTMSKALTQIAYDFSSLYNLNIDDALKKVQSGLAGEIEPLRRIGKDLSVAKMQQVAYGLGITQNVQKMAQSDKAMLRTIVLLRQSGSAMGDLARTINSPANQLRIFNSQIIQLKRALGYILLPTLQMILPYLIAMTKVLRIIGEIIANLFGFKMPVFNYDSLQGNLALGATDSASIADNMASAAKSAKEAASYRVGFDELNVVNPATSSAGTGANGGIGGGNSDILAQEMQRLTDAYDKTFLAGVDDKVTKIVGKMVEWLGIGALITNKEGELEVRINAYADKMEWLHTKLGKILITVGAIGTAMLAWKIAGGIYAFFTAEFTKAVFATTALVAHKVALIANDVALGILNGTYVTAIINWTTATAAKIADTISTTANKVATSLLSLSIDILNGSMLKNISAWISSKIEMLASTIALIAHTVATKAISIATMAWTVITDSARIAQLALNVAMEANPIGLVIIAVGLLVTGFILLYNKSETFRNAIDGMTKWFKDTFLPIIKNVVGWFEDLAKWIDKIFGDGNKKLTVDVNGSASGGKMPITRFAGGGMPEDGLFQANHNELVGGFAGGRTAVANNGMIVEGISGGVYEAVLRAMKDASGSGEQTINVNVDGENLFKINRKQGSRKGTQLVQAEYAR